MSNPSNPIANQPIGGITITDNTPTLSFTIPTDADNDKLVFEIELDTQNPINVASTDYRIYESRKQEGIWRYWNGSNFENLPAIGIGSTAYNQECLFTVPTGLRNAIWYWKVSVSDKLSCCKFAGGYFMQKKFCSGI